MDIRSIEQVKTMKYVIIGFPKSGQLSLIQYLKERGESAEKYDKIWHVNALEMIQQHYQNRYPNEIQFIVIIRDPIERMWSGYRFWHYHEHMTFEKYTHFYDESKDLGMENPIIQSNYVHWLDRVKPLNPWLIDFEEMINLPNFPLVNKTKFQFMMPTKIRQELENDVVLLKFKKELEDYLNKNNFKRLIIRNN